MNIKVSEGSLPSDYQLGSAHCSVTVDGQDHREWLKKNYGK